MEKYFLLEVKALKNRTGMVLLHVQKRTVMEERGRRLPTRDVEFMVWPCSRTTMMDMWDSGDNGARGLVATWAGEYCRMRFEIIKDTTPKLTGTWK